MGKTRVGTKIFAFFFREIYFLFSRNICDENTKLWRKFLRKLGDKEPQLNSNRLKFLFFKFTGTNLHNIIIFMSKLK
jgi:hypothetical protein